MAQSPVPTLCRRRLGAQLRSLRTSALLTLDQVSEATGWDRAKVSRVENARSGIRSQEVHQLLALYGVTDQAVHDTLEALARHGAKRGWWQAYSDVLTPAYADFISLEADAGSMRDYQVTLIPNLLRTTTYAREMITAIHMTSPPQEVNRLVEVTTARQAVLTRPDPPLSFHAVIHETALHQRTAHPATMRQQLLRLLEVSELPHVSLQVLPLGSLPHPGVTGGYTVLSCSGGMGLDVVLVEGLTCSSYLEEEREVAAYMAAFERLRAMALPPADSLALVERLGDNLRGTSSTTRPLKGPSLEAGSL